MRIMLGIGILGACFAFGCGEPPSPASDAGTAAAPAAPAPAKPLANVPPLEENNIVRIASASPDHTTLVAALQAADYVASVAASGPLTVFAPTNQAFDALPAGTVESLLEPANADQLRNVLKYHVTTSSLAASSFKDGQSLGMANGARTTIQVAGDQVSINGARIVASIPASNGIVHVIDAVLLPPAKP
jgi:uncharacterized surface protein with fasciclin (FAS1) repeats